MELLERFAKAKLRALQAAEACGDYLTGSVEPEQSEVIQHSIEPQEEAATTNGVVVDRGTEDQQSESSPGKLMNPGSNPLTRRGGLDLTTREGRKTALEAWKAYWNASLPTRISRRPHTTRRTGRF